MDRIALISDIHSNYAALEAVLGVVAALEVDGVVCAGDVVGYCASPSACIAALRRMDASVIKGNHDAAAVGELSLRYFPRNIQKALKWTSKVLSREEREYLQSRPTSLDLAWGLVTHGSPHDPLQHYVHDAPAALLIFRFGGESCYVVGHTHVQIAFAFEAAQGVKMIPARVGHQPGPSGESSYTLELEADCRYILNPGSSGQPRDGDFRAGFAVLDVDGDRPTSITWYRVPYDVEATRADVLENRLPPQFGDRLLVGR